jgi:hypothetical protein
MVYDFADDETEKYKGTGNYSRYGGPAKCIEYAIPTEMIRKNNIIYCIENVNDEIDFIKKYLEDLGNEKNSAAKDVSQTLERLRACEEIKRYGRKGEFTKKETIIIPTEENSNAKIQGINGIEVSFPF